MHVGYSFWGHLADIKYDDKGNKVSTPDGNATYSWALINALVDKGHKIYRMMPDRDIWAVRHFKSKAFESFIKDARYQAYNMIGNYSNTFPELDMLILEWRWPIYDKEGEDAIDYKCQQKLLECYCNTNTKIVIFDLDYKFNDIDFDIVKPDAILDCGYKHKDRKEFVHVDIPFDFKYMFNNNFMTPLRDLIYIGNRYERDRHIDKYIVPLANKGVNIKLFGNWLEGNRDSKQKWPMLDFGPRIDVLDFKDNYGTSKATLLLAKDEYCKYGFMTMRLLEALFFNCCPIGLAEFKGIENFLPDRLIVNDIHDVLRILTKLKSKTIRSLLINQLKCNLNFMDASNFVKKLEKIL